MFNDQYSIKGRKTYLLLDNIRSVHNVGSIFRTAECAGVSKIFCFGTTPAPIDRFGRKRKDFAKVSLGAEGLVPWEHVGEDSTAKTIKLLKKQGFMIVAVEQTKDSIDYRKWRETRMGGMEIVGDRTNRGRLTGKSEKVEPDVIFILGNEVDGVSQKLIKLADIAIEIPMKGKKESLNVSVAAGIVLFGTY